jgi:hypothetical protein
MLAQVPGSRSLHGALIKVAPDEVVNHQLVIG